MCSTDRSRTPAATPDQLNTINHNDVLVQHEVRQERAKQELKYKQEHEAATAVAACLIQNRVKTYLLTKQTPVMKKDETTEVEIPETAVDHKQVNHGEIRTISSSPSEQEEAAAFLIQSIAKMYLAKIASLKYYQNVNHEAIRAKAITLLEVTDMILEKSALEKTAKEEAQQKMEEPEPEPKENSLLALASKIGEANNFLDGFFEMSSPAIESPEKSYRANESPSSEKQSSSPTISSQWGLGMFFDDMKEVMQSTETEPQGEKSQGSFDESPVESDIDDDEEEEPSTDSQWGLGFIGNMTEKVDGIAIKMDSIAEKVGEKMESKATSFTNSGIELLERIDKKAASFNESQWGLGFLGSSFKIG